MLSDFILKKIALYFFFTIQIIFSSTQYSLLFKDSFEKEKVLKEIVSNFKNNNILKKNFEKKEKISNQGFLEVYDFSGRTVSKKDYKSIKRILKESSLFKKDSYLLEEKIKKYFIKKGFWDFEVKVKQLFKDDKKFLTIKIKKGKKRILKELKIKSSNNLIFPKSIFNNFDRKKSLSPIFIENVKKNLEKFIYKKGFSNVLIKTFLNEKDLDDKKISVDVNFSVSLGKQLYFGKIEFSKSKNFKEEDFYNFLFFKEGDPLDLHKINLSIKKLLSLGIFKDVKILYSNEFESSGKVPVFIKLFDDSNYELKVNFGFSAFGQNENIYSSKFENYFTHKAGASFRAKNQVFFLDSSDFNFSFNSNFQGLNFSYKCGGFRENSYDFNLNSFFLHENRLILGSDEKKDILNFGAFTQVSKNSKSFLKPGMCIGFQNFKIKDCQKIGTIKYCQDWVSYLLLEPNFYFDKSSGFWELKKGFFSYFYSSLIFPLKNNFSPIVKLFCESSFFLPLFYDFCLAFKIRASSNNFFTYDKEKNKIKNTESPFSELLKISENSEKLESLFVDLKDGFSEEPFNQDILNIYEQGSYKFLTVKNEARFKISKILGASFFFNFGINNFKNKNFFLGLGLRVKTPFSLVFFDGAWNYKKNNVVWRVALGEYF